MKNPLSYCSAVVLALGLAACSGGSSGGLLVEFGFTDLTLCCDPSQGAPGKVGEAFINATMPSDLDPATVEFKFRYNVVGSGNVRFSLVQGAIVGAGSTAVDILLDDCDFEEILTTISIEITGLTLDTREAKNTTFSRLFRIVNTCPQPAPIPPQIIAEEIIGESIPDFLRFTMPAPTGVLTGNSDPLIARRIPDPVTEVFQIGYLVVDLDQAQLEAAFLGPNARFPIGDGPHGRTLAPEFASPMVPGRYAFTWQCTSAAVPLNDPVHDYQLSYVADADLNPNNNYVGSAPWTADYWNNTDLQYSAQYNPVSDWRLQVTRANSTGGLQAAFSSARAIMYQQVNFFVIPWSEAGSPSEFSGRHTAFTSDGSAGQNGGYWSGDQTPEQPDLVRYSWQLSL